MGLPWWLNSKESPCNARNVSSVPELGRSPGNLLQCFCLENPLERESWWDTVHSITKSWTWLKLLSLAHNGRSVCSSSSYCIFLKLSSIIVDDMGILRKNDVLARRNKTFIALHLVFWGQWWGLEGRQRATWVLWASSFLQGQCWRNWWPFVNTLCHVRWCYLI